MHKVTGYKYRLHFLCIQVGVLHHNSSSVNRTVYLHYGFMTTSELHKNVINNVSNWPEISVELLISRKFPMSNHYCKSCIRMCVCMYLRVKWLLTGTEHRKTVNCYVKLFKANYNKVLSFKVK